MVHFKRSNSAETPRLYRCLLVGKAGAVESVEEISAQSDEEALKQGRMLLSGSRYAGFELWAGGRRLYSETRASLMTVAE